MRVQGEWFSPGGSSLPGVLSGQSKWILTIGEEPIRATGNDLGEGTEDELLPVVFGTDEDGQRYTLVGALRRTPPGMSPSKWSVVTAWRGMHSQSPEIEPVAAIRVAGSNIANEAARSLPPGRDHYVARVPGAQLLMPESRKMSGWTRIEFDEDVPLDEAEQEAWKVTHMEALLCGAAVCPAHVHGVLPDGRVVERLQDRDRHERALIGPRNFVDGFEAGIQEWWRACAEMPLVVERWITALEKQPVLSQAYLITTALQPLYDAIAPELPRVEDWVNRKERILKALHPDDRGFVDSRLPKNPPPPSIRDKAGWLLEPIAGAFSLDEGAKTTMAGNFEDLRTELVHRTNPLYTTTTRYLELQRMANLGVSAIMYHLWVRIGVDPSTAARIAGEHHDNWLTWVKPSSTEEQMVDRRGT